MASELQQLVGKGLRRHRVYHGRNQEIAHTWVNPIATATVQCICRDCNRGWMKLLEERVIGSLGSRIIDGLSIIPVAEDERRDLPAWAFKTAAVGQYMSGIPIKPIVAGARGYYTRGEPPPNTVVFVSPPPTPAFDAVIMWAHFPSTQVHWGYVAQVVVGRISLTVVGSSIGRALPIQPSSVLGVEASEIWPHPPGWSPIGTLPTIRVPQPMLVVKRPRP